MNDEIERQWIERRWDSPPTCLRCGRSLIWDGADWLSSPRKGLTPRKCPGTDETHLPNEHKQRVIFFDIQRLR